MPAQRSDYLIAGMVALVLVGGGMFGAGRMTAPVTEKIVQVPVVKVVKAHPRVPSKKADPFPQIVAPAPIIRQEGKIKRGKTRVVQQRKPTANECTRMASGIAIVGRARVKSSGQELGYSGAQVERALRDCGL